MGRPSKLTDAQWGEVESRLLSGETARSLGREFGVSEGAIRKKFGAHQKISAQSTQVRTVAEKLAEANIALTALPPSQRAIAVSLSEELRQISTHMAGAARFGAATAHRLSGIAHAKVQEIDDAAPLDDKSRDALKDVAVLTRMANDAATIPTNLLAANKDRIKRAEEEEGADAIPSGLDYFYGQPG